MALLYCDSFDHYTTLSHKLWAQTPSASGAGSFGTGRNGSGWSQNDYRHGIYRPIASHSSGFIGFAIYVRAYPSAGMLTALMEGSTRHLALNVNSSGQLYTTIGNTSVIAGTTTAINTLLLTTWYYVELGYVIADSPGGSVTIRVNESTLINTGSVDTRNGGAGTVNNIQIGGYDNGQTQSGPIFDDLYVTDPSGSSNTSFLGDVRVQAIFPDSNGTSSQWTGSDGNSTDNYQLVDEAAAPVTTDYVQALTVGAKDTYNYGSITPTSGTVYGVQIVPYLAKSDAGVRSVVTVARLGGSETDSASDVLSTTATYYPDVRDTKPGGGAWTISDVNSAEFGIKVAS